MQTGVYLCHSEALQQTLGTPDFNPYGHLLYRDDEPLPDSVAMTSNDITRCSVLLKNYK